MTIENKQVPVAGVSRGSRRVRDGEGWARAQVRGAPQPCGGVAATPGSSRKAARGGRAVLAGTCTAGSWGWGRVSCLKHGGTGCCLSAEPGTPGCRPGPRPETSNCVSGCEASVKSVSVPSAPHPRLVQAGRGLRAARPRCPDP